MPKQLSIHFFLILTVGLIVFQNALCATSEITSCSECQLSLFEQKSIENGCIDTNEVYNACAPQHDFLKRKMKSSLSEGKYLLVIFGANWCNACRSLDQKLLELEGDPMIEEILSSISIGLSDSKNKKSASGELSTKWLSTYLKSKIEVQYFPYAILINPYNKKFTILNHMGKTVVQLKKELLKQHSLLEKQ
ncbi:MAG TPA: thioredoxin family protein [Pseudobdellovibrionaceae bacterium]|nr:thioredoxin family protein [Pseudobdellovibrionaceae bacterium]